MYCSAQHPTTLLRLPILCGVLLAMAFMFVQPARAQLKAVELLTENRVNPLGLDQAPPRFSWRLQAGGKNILQTAYELTLTQGGKKIWNSGKVASAQSVQVVYNGPALNPATMYQWQVRVWDNTGRQSDLSERAFFSTGLWQPEHWKARWIAPGYQEDSIWRPCPIFRRQFTAGKKPVQALIYMTCHGIYEAQCNGKRISDNYFAPGWTSYEKRLQYQVYDISALLQQGSNSLEVMLGNGWYRGSLGFEGKSDYYGKKAALLCQLELVYADGSRETIVTDESWQCTTGEIRYADLYNGEIIDHRKERDAWSAVKTMSFPFKNLVSTLNEPVTKHEAFAPVKIFTTPAGDTVVDFGQNLVGWVKLTVEGNAGDSIQLEHAEVLDKEGNFYTKNLRMAKARDVFILNGKGAETFEPHFTFHGFRYVRLRGLRRALQPAQLTAYALYSHLQQTGSFSCSNALLNQLQHNIVWSQNGNFLDLPTDCPQRDERMGWMGDAMLFSRTAAYNRNVNNFFYKWLKDVSAEQFENGVLPFVVPNILGPAGGAAGWADAGTVIPWNMYQVYGDKRLLEEQYPSMKAWVHFMETHSTDYIRNKSFHFGDWLSYRTEGAAEVDKSAVTDIPLLAQAFFAWSTQLLVNAATVLKKEEDVKHYSTLLAHIKEAFCSEYLTPNSRLLSNTQTAYVLALQFDLLPEKQRAAAAKKLAENIISYDNHITTGLLGTPWICHVLSRYGYTDLAYKLLLQETYPSWLYPVKMGATTIWERWDGIKPNGSFQDPTMNSFNHYAYGAIGDWMYRTMAGIDLDSAGYKRIKIRPRPGGGIQYVKAGLETYYGKVGVYWKLVGNKIAMDVEIPANTTATIYIPKGDFNTWDSVQVGSGSYHFGPALSEAQRYEWKGSWITNTEDTAARVTPYFRKTFTAGKSLAKATAYVCGVGYHQLYINSKPVTDAVLEQGYTRYDKRLLYTSYDVTPLMTQGKNSIAAALGNGWMNVQTRTIWNFDKIGWRKTPRLLLNLVLEYADGTTETIVTDGSWKWHAGAVQFNSLYAGEIYDARQEMPGWKETAFDDSHWVQAFTTVSPGGTLELQQMPSVKIIRSIKPVGVKELGNGRWLFDMGQNFAGVATLAVEGKAGDSVILRYGEVLKNGQLDLQHNASQMIGPAADPQFQTDIYVLKGGRKEWYTPAFTYHGFQYVEVQASAGIRMNKESLEGLFYSTGFTSAGRFNSSDTMLNKLYAAALQSYQSNYISIPTDCPQREKSGWTADAHIAAEMGLWNFDAASSYRKWLRDLRDVQLEDGNLPGIAPTNGRGYHWTSNTDDGFGPAWGSALPLITWYLYLYKGDTTVLEENFAAIKRMTDRLAMRSKGYLYSTGFGDWLALQETPVPLISTAYFYTDARLVSKMAAILGKTKIAAAYGSLADSIKHAFHARFFDAAKGAYKDSTVTAMSCALFHDLCPDALRPQVAAQLNAAIVKRNYHTDFGMLGTKYVLNALSDAGYVNTAYRLLTDTAYAGWGHWIANGATTLFEDWKGEFSHNHAYAGDYAAWYYKSLAGIQPVEQTPGFKQFKVQPVFPEGVQDIAVTHNTPYGEVAVSWKRKNTGIDFMVTVPQATTARLLLPGKNETLPPGVHHFTIPIKDVAASHAGKETP